MDAGCDWIVPAAQSRPSCGRSQQWRRHGRSHTAHIDPNAPFTAVHASRGKVVRAEPVAALYEQEPGRVFHIGTFPTLEDQMCGFTTDFDRKTAWFSPDRVDALVWAMSDLLVE